MPLGKTYKTCHSLRLLIEPRSNVETFDNRSRYEDGATRNVDASVRSLEPRRRDGEPRAIRLAQKSIENVIHLLFPSAIGSWCELSRVRSPLMQEIVNAGITL
jgi:hypothetical protein